MKDLVNELIEISSEIKYLSRIKNFASLPGLLERYQTLANRLEAILWQQKDIKRLREELKELKEEKKALKAEIEALEKKKEKLTGEKPEKKKSRSISYDFLDD